MQITAYTRKSTSMLAHLKHLKASAAAAVSLATPTYAAGPSITAVPGGAYFGGVELPDGKVLMAPYSSGYWTTYDPTANSLSNVLVEPATGRFSGGALSVDGYAVFGPRLSTYVMVYRADIGFHQINLGEAGASTGAVALKDGRVILVPRSAGKLRIVDPVSLTVADGPVTDVSFGGGSLLPDGRVLLYPWSNSTYLWLYDPATNMLTQGPESGSGPWSASVTLPSGDILMVPYTGVDIAIYVVGLGTVYRRNTGSLAGSAKFSGGALLPDGRVLLAPYSYGSAVIYDPASDTHVNLDVGMGALTTQYWGAVSLSNGKVLMIPYSADHLGLVTATSSGILPSAYRQSIFANRC